MIRKLLSLLHNKILIVAVLILIQLFVFFGIVFKLSVYFVAIFHPDCAEFLYEYLYYQ